MTRKSMFRFALAFVALVGAFAGGVALGSGPISGEASVEVTQTSFKFGIASTVAGGAQTNLTVNVVDQNNTILPTFRDKITFDSSDATATLPADYTFTATDKGIHRFVVVLREAGPQTITVTDVSGQTITTTTTVTTS